MTPFQGACLRAGDTQGHSAWRCRSWKAQNASIDSCVHLPESNRTLRDGSFGVGFSQALRARLRSHRPSGTFQTRFSSGREENLKMKRDFAVKHGKINGLHPSLNLAPFYPGLYELQRSCGPRRIQLVAHAATAPNWRLPIHPRPRKPIDRRKSHCLPSPERQPAHLRPGESPSGSCSIRSSLIRVCL
jgi:hypothetical protein